MSEAPMDPTPNEQREQRPDDDRPTAQQYAADSSVEPPQEAAGRSEARSSSPVLDLPEIPGGDLEFDLDSILKTKPDPDSERVKKRASNVLKLSQENEKLKEELRAMQERLEKAEARREQLARKQQQVVEPPSN
ncbi:hypothetical protein R3P38DRAFT_2998336 [Favolaschia claudopus]|uniref:Uncharacterized protein n=1 Tax=Favolaschia claudopus TaxID=2862362 RepID=A0AAW0AQK7_9AGAR